MTLLQPVERPLSLAIGDFLSWGAAHVFKEGSGTPRTYGIKLNMYARHFGPDTPVRQLSGQDWHEACLHHWDSKSPVTYNSGRRAAVLFLEYCRTASPPLTDARPPAEWVSRSIRKTTRPGLPREAVRSLFDPDAYPLRERTLWSMMYDSSAGLGTILSLDIADLNMKDCYATLPGRDGGPVCVAWSPPTCALLEQYLNGRTYGPVFLGSCPPWNWRERPPADQGPGMLYRLTPHRARILYRQLTGDQRPLKLSRMDHLAAADGQSAAAFIAGVASLMGDG